jgi:hypothetical protein
MDIVSREVGKHDAQIESLQEDMRSLKSDVAEIKEILNQTKGGWKALAILGGISATIGGVVAKVVGWYYSH